jgi:hypothetical protein
VLALGLVALVAAGCGSSKAKTSTAPPSSTAGASATTAGTSPPGTAGPASVWTRKAVDQRGQDGKTFQLTCTPDGTAQPVWGTGPYTDDSSVCTAAVQSGLITLATGGTASYLIGGAQDSYAEGQAHGISSSAYGSWPGSFTFPDAKGSIAAGPASWNESMSSYRGQEGKQVTVVCSPNGTLASVWGTGPFTDDSSVCSAAVFAGLITTAQGGSVVATVAPGQKSYQGGTAHGVTTTSYGEWSGSFTVATS